MDAPETTDRARSSEKKFYDDALTESEREKLADAAQLEALADEIAALRVRLFETLKNHPEDLKLALYGMNTLMRMVVAQYRLSPRASKHLADHMTALLNDLGDQILPADR